MIWWIALGAYALGFLGCWRWFTIGFLIRMETSSYYRGYERTVTLDSTDRALAAVSGTGCALIWPLVLLWKILVAGTGRLRTPREKAAARARELAALRKVADEHGLVLPDQWPGGGE